MLLKIETLSVLLIIYLLAIPIVRIIRKKPMEHIRENIGLTILAGITLFNKEIPLILLDSLWIITITVFLSLIVEIFKHRHRSKS